MRTLLTTNNSQMHAFHWRPRTPRLNLLLMDFSFVSRLILSSQVSQSAETFQVTGFLFVKRVEQLGEPNLRKSIKPELQFFRGREWGELAAKF